MTTSTENRRQKDEELVTIDGLQFKKYIVDCMEVCTKMEKCASVREWLNKKIIPHMLMPYLEGRLEDYANEVHQRIEKDGY